MLDIIKVKYNCNTSVTTPPRNKKRHSHGDGDRQRLTVSRRYDGEWKDGLRHGYGISVEDVGSRYSGEWRDGKQHGMGILESEW